jgi:uncharacterized DUF497 family protein
MYDLKRHSFSLVLLLIMSGFVACDNGSKASHEVKKRTPSFVGASDVSTLMKEGFAKTFFAITTAEDLDLFLKILDSNYSSFGKQKSGVSKNIFSGLQKKLRIPVWNGERSEEGIEADYKREVDVKLAAALLIPLRKSRGIVWRLHPLSDGVDFTQTSMITQIAGMMSAVKMYSSYDVGQNGKNISNAMLDYVTQPWFGKNSEASLKQIQTVSEFQKFVKSDYADTIENTIKKVKGINFGDHKKIYFDSQLATNTKAFDPDYRYASLGTIEKWEILANLYMIRHSMRLYIGTNVDALKAFSKDVSKSTLFGGNNYFFLGNFARRRHFKADDRNGKSVYGLTYGHRQLDLAMILVKGKYKKLFTVKNRKYYTDAFDDLKEYVKLKRKIFKFQSDGKRDNNPEVQFYFNPFRILEFDRESKKVANKSLTNLEEMLKDNPGFIVNNITGDELNVRIKSLYYDIDDFKLLVPGIYSKSRNLRGGRTDKTLKVDKSYYSKVDIGLKNKYILSVRDYRAGQPIKWNMNILRKIFPNIDSSLPNGTDAQRVKLHIRSLNQSFGAGGVLLPMMSQF